MRRVITSGLALLVIYCASSTVNSVTVPLQYKTMATPAEFPSAQSCASVSRVDVTDKRTTQTLGVRYPQEHKSMTADVMSSGDVAAWLRSGVEAALKQGGVAMKSGGPVLHVSLDNIKTDESVYRRATYGARVNVTTELVSSSGRSCWHDSVEGFSENYGYAGSAENYQETLNHALDRAMIRMLGSGEFKRAVCDCG
ncbi:MAG TPA: hypothetical protein VGS96_02455 [Thermoanaerobaculia bacterium]|jgi:hypothetical protein|nr:hypothetical protein [Thermoanaerobaculia bacterium]